jgi:quinol monooxygenase YgiN
MRRVASGTPVLVVRRGRPQSSEEATEVSRADQDAVGPGGEVPGDVELTMVLLAFEAADPDRLLPVLSRYVVLTRGHAGCRNVDLVMSATRPNRFVVIEKWDSPAAQQAHFDSADMVEMARSCEGLLSGPPDVDLFEPISAHDLW